MKTLFIMLIVICSGYAEGGTTPDYEDGLTPSHKEGEWTVLKGNERDEWMLKEVETVEPVFRGWWLVHSATESGWDEKSRRFFDPPDEMCLVTANHINFIGVGEGTKIKKIYKVVKKGGSQVIETQMSLRFEKRKAWNINIGKGDPKWICLDVLKWEKSGEVKVIKSYWITIKK